MLKMDDYYDGNGHEIPAELRGITASVELITKDIAEELLEKMPKNRNIHEGQVKKYINDLQNGRFTFCPNPIILNRDGKMIDGQHRCKAVVESGKPFWGIVLQNVPESSVIDRGAPRRVGEELYMRGILDSEMSKPHYIAIARAYLRMKYGSHGQTDTEIGEFVNRYQEEIFEAYSISEVGANRSPICKKAGIQAGIFAALCCGVPYEKLRDFFRVANSGFANSNLDSPAIILRNYILGENGTYMSVWQENACRYTETAIADYIAQKPRRKRYSDPQHIYINNCPAVIL